MSKLQSTLPASPIPVGSRIPPRTVWITAGALLAAVVGVAFAVVVIRSPGAAGPAAAPEKVAAAPAKTPPATTRAAAPAAAATPCAQCGVVESVSEVQVKGEGTGLGAVAGGVIGGVVGNQVGGGDGKKVMTVLGAVGGGLAGHEVEKRARATTSYTVKVRLDDGTLKTLTLPTAPKKGERVAVEGTKLRVLPASAQAKG